MTSLIEASIETSKLFVDEIISSFFMIEKDEKKIEDEEDDDENDENDRGEGDKDENGDQSIEYSENFELDEESNVTSNTNFPQSIKKLSKSSLKQEGEHEVKKDMEENNTVNIDFKYDNNHHNNSEDLKNNMSSDNIQNIKKNDKPQKKRKKQEDSSSDEESNPFSDSNSEESDDNNNDNDQDLSVSNDNIEENEVKQFQNLEAYLYFKCQQIYQNDLEDLDLEIEENIVEKMNDLKENLHDDDDDEDNNDNNRDNDEIEVKTNRTKSSKKNDEISDSLIPYLIAETIVSTITTFVTSSIVQLTSNYKIKSEKLANQSKRPLLTQTSSQQFRKREGIIYKRASFQGTGKLLISGGASGDYTISSNTEVFNLEKSQTKLIKICINDIIFKYKEDNQKNLKDLIQFNNPTITITVTYNHTVKIINYPNDNNYHELGNIQRRKYNLSNNRHTSINQCIQNFIWSKLHLKDEKWRNIDLRNYQVNFHLFIYLIIIYLII